MGDWCEARGDVASNNTNEHHDFGDNKNSMVSALQRRDKMISHDDYMKN
jgi:hypothetical protein